MAGLSSRTSTRARSPWRRARMKPKMMMRRMMRNTRRRRTMSDPWDE
jgi:hypothetical protein